MYKYNKNKYKNNLVLQQKQVNCFFVLAYVFFLSLLVIADALGVFLHVLTQSFVVLLLQCRNTTKTANTNTKTTNATANTSKSKAQTHTNT